MKFKEKLEFIKECALLLKEKRNWILLPILIIIIATIFITTFIQTPALLPFFYAVF